MEKPDRSRRTFIAALISLPAGLYLVGRFLRPAIEPKERVLIVEKGAIPNHGALVFRESRVAVIREAAEIYALGLVCTHLGCTVSVTPGELVCPCHGSAFDRRGRVVRGPADRPLVRYRIEERGDRVAVYL